MIQSGGRWRLMLLLLLCRATYFKDFGLGWWWRLGERCPTTTTSVVRYCNYYYCRRRCRRRLLQVSHIQDRQS
ncbi:hypothetical protein F5888DRAFT_1716987 [Russula emetica]|nr:hypothetical protein F5888DRAFT_1716987 [Russula emetica]